jgi:hypothetical protein
MAVEINTDTIGDAVVSRPKNSAVLLPRVLILNQVAAYLGLTPDALEGEIHIGRIPTVEIDSNSASTSSISTA